jgi:hypothetical protein
MPRVLELVSMPDGRVGIILDVPPDAGNSITLWTEAEREVHLREAAKASDEIETLRDLLRQHRCNAERDMSVGECVDSDWCNCSCGLKLRD